MSSRNVSNSYDIRSSQPFYNEREPEAAVRVIESGYTAEGPESRQFEQELATFLDLENAVVTHSGTAALHLAMRALGVQSGDEIIIPAFTCQAVLNAVFHAGASPVIADVDPETYSLSVETITPHLNPNTALIIQVHNFGYPVNKTGLYDLGVPVIDDIATAVGSKSNGRMTGSQGIAACGSLYATKPLAAGYGGFIASNNESIIGEIHNLKRYDGRDRFRVSYNESLSDIQSAIARVQLNKLPDQIARRRQIGARYNKNLTGLSKTTLRLPELIDGHSFYRYLIQLDRAEQLAADLQSHGVEAKPPVHRPLHHWLTDFDCPVSDALYKKTLLLPNHPGLSDDEIDRVSERVIRFITGDGSAKA